MAHSPSPWKWQGEDYRGGWGWQILVDANGNGILCGEGPDEKPYKHLLAYMPIDAKFCKTGWMSDEESAPAAHVFQQDASLITAAPDMLNALIFIRDELQVYLNSMPEDMASRQMFLIADATIAKAEGRS